MAEDAKKLSLGGKISHFFGGVRAEYNKIVFTDRATVRKQTIAVVIVSIFVGVLIAAIDFILKYLLHFVI